MNKLDLKLVSLSIVTLFSFTSRALDCPSGTFNYNNQSCYLFLGSDVTEFLYVDYWQKPKKRANASFCLGFWGKGPDKPEDCPPPAEGFTRGRNRQNINPCVWNRKQAQEICEDAHAHEKYKHLVNYSTYWHLAVIESVDEDDWLRKMMDDRIDEMGTSFWMDLVNVYGKYEWKSRSELATWIRKPAGIDRWWERTNVLMKRRQDDEEMCYEYHVDYMATVRPPKMPMRVRGWHPRACFQAYEQESDLDHAYDFSALEYRESEQYWRLTVAGISFTSYCTLGDEEYCLIPEAFPLRWTCEERPIVYNRDKYRMRLAPIGAVCEADIKCFDPNATEINCGGG